MGMRGLVKDVERETKRAQKVELADAHCHLDLITDHQLVLEAVNYGVLTIVTDGIDLVTSKTAIRISQLNKNVYAAVGIDPEKALYLEGMLVNRGVEDIKGLLKSNSERIVGIGEIGLDYTKAKDSSQIKRQKNMFEKMLDLANEFELPVSVHSRESMDDVLSILKEKGNKKVQLHFFEGNMQQAKDSERRGYMISIPPIDSSKRRSIIKDIAIDNLMPESDSPVVGATPKDVEKSVRMIAEVKGIDFERAAETLVSNTKRFFNIGAKPGFMRS
jgi:TatD DNase family protein